MTSYERRVKRLHDHVTKSKKPEADNANYDEKTVPELKDICDKKGLKYDSKVKKDELIELLEGAE